MDNQKNNSFGYNNNFQEQNFYTNQLNSFEMSNETSYRQEQNRDNIYNNSNINYDNLNNNCYSCPNQNNPYMQNQNIHNQYMGNTNIENNNSKGRKVKQKKAKIRKKRKHKFLKFLLFNILLICIIVFGVKFMNNLVQKELDAFCPNTNNIFTFENEENTIYYVTGDFNVPINYDYNGKTYEVVWHSNNKKMVNIKKDGKVVINRPTSKSQKVILTQTYKKLFGKGTKSYEFILIPSETINIETLDVVTKKEMETKSYNKEMEMSINESGQIEYMYGDFNNTYIYSKEDALLLLEKYREELGIDDRLEFECEPSNIIKSITTISYTLNAKYNNIPLNYDNVEIIVNSNNFELIKLVNNISSTLEENIQKNENINIENITKKYIEENNLIIGEYKTTIGEEEILDGMLVIRTYVVSKNNFYELIINLNNGEIINCIDLYTINKLIDGIRYETTIGNGKDLSGDNLIFTISKDNYIDTKTKEYVLFDKDKNMMCYESLVGKDAWHSNMKEGGDDKYNIAVGFYSTVASDTKEFNNPLAVETYTTMQQVYDMYYNQLSWDSYNGKGGKLKLIVDCVQMTDNGGWMPVGNLIAIGPNKIYRDNVVTDVKVLAHEYTHGVFQSRTNYPYWITGEEVLELKSINESYADTMACLLNGGEDWVIFRNETIDGQEFLFRDIENINSIYNFGGVQYPSVYLGENWSTDCHANSIMLSHIAYEMNESPLFTRELIRDIWFESMSYGYKKDATFYNFRKNIMQAAEQLGCDKKQLDFIALQFDNIEVYDKDYVITNDEFLSKEDIDFLNNKNTILKTNSDAIIGDLIFDDDTSCQFLIVTSPIGVAFGKTPILIYQEKNGASNQQIEETRLRLEKAFNKCLQDGLENEIPIYVNIQYQQVPKTTFNVLEKILKESDSYMKEMTLQSLAIEDISEVSSENENILNVIFKLMFLWDIEKVTAYDFYNNIGILDFVE